MDPNTKLLIVILISCLTTCMAENCDNVKSFKVMTRSDKEMSFLKELQRQSFELHASIDHPPRSLNSSFVFSTPDCQQSKVMSMMRRFGISDYEVLRPHVEMENDGSEHSRRSNIFDEDSVLRKYLSYDESDEYIERMVEIIRNRNSNIIVKTTVESFTYENRMIKSITIMYRTKPENPVIVMEAGIHAREWHAHSLGLYLLKKLADEAALDTNGLIYQASFVIIPGVNPDGYEFSRSKNKMWRKTRKPVSNSCIGVDGNRNFDAHWEVGQLELNPCEDVYKGTKPFSEPETQVIKKVLDEWRGQCKLFVSIHTYGNSIIYPWGWTTESHPRRDQLQKIAQAGADAVFKATGTRFVTDQSGTGLYVSAGGSDDYAIDKGGVPYAFTFELGAEKYGFAVEEAQLKNTVEEGYIAIYGMIMQALQM